MPLRSILTVRHLTWRANLIVLVGSRSTRVSSITDIQVGILHRVMRASRAGARVQPEACVTKRTARRGGEAGERATTSRSRAGLMRTETDRCARVLDACPSVWTFDIVASGAVRLRRWTCDRISCGMIREHTQRAPAIRSQARQDGTW